MLNKIKRLIRKIFKRQRSIQTDISDVFTDVYVNKKWGSKEGQKYFSGGGSSLESSAQYREFLDEFLTSHCRDLQTIVDIGCGDFNVMKNVSIPKSMNYIGCDLVSAVIEENNRLYAIPGTRHFEVVNAVSDEIPNGDVCCIRQVFQHLSNSDIQRVLAKIRSFRYVLVTDGQPTMVVERINFDKPSDGKTRRDTHSNGLWLELPPFNLQCDIVLEYPIRNGSEILRTVLIENTTTNRAP